MRKLKITKESIISELEVLGLKENDIIFISADLMRVGLFNTNSTQTKKDWEFILKYFVNEKNVTFVIPAYTNFFWKFKKNKKITFSENVKPNAGALSEIIWGLDEVKRSKHPTHSVFAIGSLADTIIEGHNEKSSCYKPYQTIYKLDGKNLMLGSLDDHNAPMTFHLVQEQLGHTKNHPYSGFRQAYYITPNGDKKLFTRNDVGGCTRGGINTIGRHLNCNAIEIAKVGRTKSALINVKKSYEIFNDIFKNNPSLIRCDDSNCISCHGRFRYNGYSAVKFWTVFVLKLIKRGFYAK